MNGYRINMKMDTVAHRAMEVHGNPLGCVKKMTEYRQKVGYIVFEIKDTSITKIG